MPEKLSRQLLAELKPFLSKELMAGRSMRAISLEGVRHIAGRYGISLLAALKLCLLHDIWPLRFIRNSGVFSAREQSALLDSHVAIVGCGGLGSYAAQLLARAGVGGLTLCDGDTFSESNLNRQAGCRESSIGLNKARVTADTVKDLAGHLSLKVFPVNLNRQNAPEIIEGAGLVMDCLDSLPARYVLAEVAGESQLPFVHGTIAGHEGFAAVSLPDDDILRTLYGDAPPSPSDCAEMALGVPTVTPAATASLQCALTIRTLLGKTPEPGTLHHLDISAPFLETLKL